MKKIGFIGLGTMGLPMAENLLKKGFELTVYNRTAAKAESLVQQGARQVHTPREAAEGQDMVITIVSDDASIYEVYQGENGIIAAVQQGLTVMDCSTVSPPLALEIAADVHARGGIYLDAPVTGSKPAAIDGTLVFMVGGNPEAIESHQDVFDTLGRLVIPMGPNGSGATAKLAHNTMVGIHTVALAEAFAIASKGGIDPSAFLQLIRNGAANSRTIELKGQKIIDGDYSNQFSLALMLKDLKLASALNDKNGVPAPMLNLAKSLFQTGQSKGYGDDDLSVIAKCYEEWIGQTINGKSL
ncbi:NAD(P)-dependent oxidoreductase [Paenibacillus bovis]|uniref:3-hydroxyisobutyrate dehydrogenase n=1 Tax=Paenibacillus bovis TaxID=1616788 RepID=A0A172ZFX1_9BACL|nr:NAD(P)-dependent oxidoreductase [Paenibacillus bovis]ANF96050.1 3-hydroxyisobutyrate dehydrogenase [Paenibacillus bovis]